VQVTIAGDGPQRADLEALSRKLGCEKSIRFVGQVNRERLSSLMASADFAVQASRTEGLSKAWLDAMAHGLPVLASEVGAARAVIAGEGIRGWLVPPSRPDILAETIVDVLRSPRDWSALRSRCRQYAETRTIERWAEEVGQRCAERWNCSFRDGKLKAVSI
jgi:glycosyltransferase involved in cell wall biosynthesis